MLQAHMIPDLVGGLGTPIFAGIILFSINWKLALATILSGAIGFGLFTGMMMCFSMDEFYALMDKMNAVVIQYVDGMKIVKAFTRTDSTFQQFTTVIKEVKDLYTEVSKGLAFPYAVMLVMMRSAAVTIVPCALYLYGEVDVPTIVLFVLVGVGFNQPLHAAMMHGGQSMHQVYSASKRIVAVMDQDELQEPLIPKEPSNNTLEFSDVSFGYDTAKYALSNVSFSMQEGTVTALVGPSGAGKSTIAKLVARFWDVDNGTISIGGVDIRDMTTKRLMEKVSLVFQDIFLFDDTVENNIGMGRKGSSFAEIKEAAKMAMCHDFVESLPEGYQTIIGQNGLKLSGGQRQRLSIARAILKDSPIVVLDEATAFLDPENEFLVQQALSSLVKSGKTLLVVAHRLSTIKGANQIIVVNEGRIEASGKHEELLESCTIYKEQWEAHNSASSWQYGMSSTNECQLVGDLTEKDVPLVQKYANLNTPGNVLSQVRAFVAEEDDHLFVASAVNRAWESLAIVSSNCIVFQVLNLVFESHQTGTMDKQAAWMFSIGLALSCIFQILVGYRANLNGHELMITVHSKLRLFLADFLRRLPMGFFTTNSIGGIDALFTTCIMFLEPHHILDSLIQAIVIPIVLWLIMAWADLSLALVLLSSVALSTVGLMWGNYVFSWSWQPRIKAATEANHRMIEYIQGIAVIRSFNLTGTQQEKFAQAIQEYKATTLRLIHWIIPGVIVFKATLELGYGIFIFLGCRRLENETLDPAQFLVFVVMAHSFYTPINEVAAFGEMYKLMERSAKVISKFLSEDLLPCSASPLIPQDASVEFRNVSFKYEKTLVLKNVSFSVSPGSTLALVGASGSGKTTIASLLARFWDTSAGEVCVGGVDIKQIATNVLLGQLTMVFQDVYLFKDTIFDNIKFGKPDASDEDVLKAAKAAQCHEFVTKLPNQYQTLVGEGGTTLSGGEKQRISIARALLKDAPIVILDEATASLDPENEKQIQLAIQSLSESKTLIVIAHRLTTIQRADKILVLDDGNIAQEGTHRDLVNQEGQYKALWVARCNSQAWKIA